MDLLTVVNKERPLNATYIPKDLICDPLSGVWIAKIVYEQFYKLNQMMQKNGLMGLVLVSGYRSYQYQKMLYTKKVKKMLLEGMRKEDACYQAAQIIAPPGCSEHQLGLAIDVTTQEMAQLEDPLTTDFEKTIQAKWLQNHAKEYGFILRYPQEKTAITHITYEPWHYRYVGINHAKKMGKLNLCLEEYEQVYLSLRTY